MAHIDKTRPRRPKVVSVVVMGALTLVLAVTVWASAQGGAVQEGQAATVAVTPTTAPEEILQEMAPGYTTFSLESGSDNGATLTLFRLKQGVTVEELQPALEAVDRAFAGEGDPAEAINAALELADVVAELDAEPGQAQRVSLVLAEGEYVLDHAPYPMEEGALPAHSFRPFTVGGEVQAETPAADVEVEMVDFAFALPSGIGAGEQLWRVRNSGEQLHHMVIFRLNEGAGTRDVLAWLESEVGPPPGDSAGYVGIMSPGYSADYQLDLTPGRYVAICFMPDHRGDATGQPHFMLGMIQEFEIAAE